MPEPESPLSTAPFSYPEVGATTGTLPAGYRHLHLGRRLGAGAHTFRRASERLMTWQMHRGAGLLVVLEHGDGTEPVITAGTTAVLGIRIGPWRIDAPIRVVEVVEGPAVRGFSYGTLPGHPEAGEERFLVHHDPDDTVRAEIRAFSRPARWFSRLGGPVARRLQDRTGRRYLDALDGRRP